MYSLNNLLIVTTIVLCLRTSPLDAYEYCSNEAQLCSKGMTHIMCGENKIVEEFDALAPMTRKLKRKFLDLHNDIRNNVACGNATVETSSLPKAARMRTLIWDDELAYVAQAHVKRCSTDPDECHNTTRFSRSGQNTAASENKTEMPLLSEVVPQHVGEWENAKLNIQQIETVIKQYVDGNKIGNFTLLVNDRVSRVGCAIARCKKESDYFYFTTCNYDYDNKLGQEVYTETEAEAGSLCKDWDADLNTDYACLCTNTGRIFPN